MIQHGGEKLMEKSYSLTARIWKEESIPMGYYQWIDDLVVLVKAIQNLAKEAKTRELVIN